MKLTLLSFVENWRAGMIVAFFLRVRIHLATRLVNTFLGHIELTDSVKTRLVNLSRYNS
jgi:hypothetical protein